MMPESENAVWGATNNPYDPTRTPGGSSGGEGALVAAGCSVMGLGSDIGERTSSVCCCETCQCNKSFICNAIGQVALFVFPRTTVAWLALSPPPPC
jgi:hypothetical protein